VLSLGGPGGILFHGFMKVPEYFMSTSGHLFTAEDKVLHS